MRTCIRPTAPTVQCKACHKPVQTCPIKTTERCLAHPNVIRLRNGEYVCSIECYDQVELKHDQTTSSLLDAFKKNINDVPGYGHGI